MRNARRAGRHWASNRMQRSAAVVFVAFALWFLIMYVRIPSYVVHRNVDRREVDRSSLGGSRPKTETPVRGAVSHHHRDFDSPPPVLFPPLPRSPPPPKPPVVMTPALKYLQFPAKCSARWSAGYVKMHKAMRAQQVEPKFITWQGPVAPLGEQLLGIVSTFLAALITRRAIIVNESKFEDAFQPVLVDWKLGDDVVMHASKYCSRGGCEKIRMSKEEGRSTAVRVDLRHAKVPDAEDRLNRFPADLEKFFRPLANFQNIILEANSGVLSEIFSSNSTTRSRLQDIGVSFQSAYACILRYLVQPQESLVALANPYISSALIKAKNSICLHLHSKPFFDFHTPYTQRQAFKQLVQSELACAIKVSADVFPGKKVSWLVVADSQMLKAMLHGWSMHHDQVEIITTKLHPENVTVQGPTPPAVAEWIVFSTCKYYVIPQSSFSKTAFAFNLNSPTVFLLPNFLKRNASESYVCDPHRPATFRDFQAWSGL